jgi:hypothetical protein
MESIIDPQTGVLLKKFTQPGEAPVGGGNGLNDFSPALVVDVSGGKWSMANCGALSITACVATDDANYISYSSTGGSADKLYIQDTSVWGTYSPQGYSFDSLEFNVKAWAATGSGANAQISVCLTANRVNCFPTAALAKTVTIQLTNAQSTVIGSDKPHFMLTDWMPAGYNIIDWVDIAPRNGTADVDASGNVTLATTAERQTWRFYSNWTNGSIIHITGSDCTITGVTSPQALTINLSSCTPALTVGTGLSWSANNFGFLVWKTTTSTDQINLQFAKWTPYASKTPGWASSGSAGYCSQKVTTRPSNGHTGFHCATRYDGSSWLYWVDQQTGETVPLGSFDVCLSGDCYNGPDPWQNGGPGLSSSTIVDDGAGRENYYGPATDNAGYSTVIKCNFTSTNEPYNITGHCTNIVPHSKGLSIQALVQSFTAGQTHPAFDANRFGCSSGNFIAASQLLGGACRVNGPGVQQNSMAWMTMFDPNKVCSGPGCAGAISAGAPGAIVAAASTFGSGGAFRWNGSHGFYYCGFNCTKPQATFYNLLGGSGAGTGPYSVQILSGNVTATPAHPCGPSQYPCTFTPSNADPGYPHNAAVTVTGYDDWVVSGEPCNPLPQGTGGGFAHGGFGEPFVDCPHHTGWDYLV